METQGASGAVRSELHALQGLPKLENTKATVFIISDVRLYRDGLSSSLAHEGSLEVLGASEPSPTLDRLARLVPDAIIFDITMRDGLQLARELHVRWPNAKIVAFAVSDIDCEIVAGAMAGISGYVHRDGSIRDLVMEVLNTVRGELHCSPRLAARLLQQVASLSLEGANAANPRHAVANGARDLTRRESEILGLIEKGLSNKEIARAINISFATVKNHVHHILDKLHVRRRTQVLARVSKHPD